MTTRWQSTAVALLLILPVPSTLHADIYRWDTGEVIPGTEGIEPGPGVQLDNRELSYASLRRLNLTEANFSFSNLTRANLFASTLTNANLSEANLTTAIMSTCTLTGANLTGAVVAGADISDTTSLGFTWDQLSSTASYQQKNLQGILLAGNDLTGWNFSGQDLTDARLPVATLENTNFSGSNLTRARLISSRLTGADLSGAVVWGTDFSSTTSLGFTEGQLISTASYQQKNLQGILFKANDLTGWNFSEQDFRYASLERAILANAELVGANLKNAYLEAAEGLPSASVSPTTVYNQWTVLPAGFDPVAAGLTLMPSAAGDFDADGVLDDQDVDFLAARIRGSFFSLFWLNDMFDLNADGSVDLDDHRMWVRDLKRTYLGDANLDGEFNSTDMVQVFAIGKYETGQEAGWAEGDWSADGYFNSSDMVAAFVDGGYEQGKRADVAAVPEPSGWLLLVGAASGLLLVRRR